MAKQFRTRRQIRYNKLIQAHLLPFEAKELARVPLTVPYMLPLMKARLERWQELTAQGMLPRQFQHLIRREYKANDWTIQKGKRLYAEPWKMLRDFEDRYKAKNPDYESPYMRRRKGQKDFLEKIERFYGTGKTTFGEQRKCQLYFVETGAGQHCKEYIPRSRDRDTGKCGTCFYYGRKGA